MIKLFLVLQKLGQYDELKSFIVCTSQHREIIEDVFTLFSIKSEYDLNISKENQSLVDISTRTLIRLVPLLLQHKPGLVLVQDDTTTAFIGALATFYYKIPVGHAEATFPLF